MKPFALLLLGVLNIGKLPVIGDGDKYQAVFADAAGLQVGEAVTLAGIKVGKVDEIELEGAQVVVSFFAKGADLPDATRASIEIKTLLGQHHLALTP
ncbi:MAG: MCE family protein, partial [Actinophytocola sp.]|nr:MCE family protein [Actinophytocola sp.]